MKIPLNRTCLFLSIFIFSASSVAYAQRSKRPVMCKKATLAAVKPMPKLSYECDAQLNGWDEKILKLRERVSAIETLESQLSSFTDPSWWTADVVDLAACDFTGKAGTLTRDQHRSFVQGDYVFWLFGNDRIRLLLIPDPCYQTEYGGANAFLLYR